MQKNRQMIKHSSCCVKAKRYIEEGVMGVERLACLSFRFEDFPKRLLVLHLDKTHNERDTIKSTKVLHCNSSKL